jgi:hypothetical protein
MIPASPVGAINTPPNIIKKKKMNLTITIPPSVSVKRAVVSTPPLPRNSSSDQDPQGLVAYLMGTAKNLREKADLYDLFAERTDELNLGGKGYLKQYKHLFPRQLWDLGHLEELW